MDKEKEELLNNFNRLDQVNRADVLHYVRTVFLTQENTRAALEAQYAPEASAMGQMT